MSDKARILKHLQEKGSITPLEALEQYGCYRLGARVFDLRRDGYNIQTTLVEGVDRNGEATRYAKYTLTKESFDGDAENQLS